MRFSKDTSWFKRMWYTYSLLLIWLFLDYAYTPVEKFVTKMVYKWKYRKEHREIKRKYGKYL